jgi:glycine betaine/proline transport system substrate-binding protein
MIRSTHRFAIGVAAFGLLLGACAPDTDTDTGADDNGDAADGSGESITLVANPWPGSAANVHVAAQVMEEQLGVDVEITEIDENAQWAGLDSGELDAVLEVWPSGHEDNYQTYIEDEDGNVEDLGELGAVGQIGWWIPSYLLEDNPEFESWEGLEGNEEMFATSETGDSGQFLAADPSFVQFDETIIENLGLDFEVVQSGSEAAQLTAVETAIEQQEPVLFYFYTPHWMHDKYDLSMVELPEYEEGCEEPEDERTCGYPEDVLFKAVNADMADESPVSYEFLSNFQMENEWQDEITFLIDEEGMSAQDAAAQWIEENEDVWQDWLP